MTQKKVLVTGAAGFIGSHLVDALLARGYSVVGVDNLSHGSMANLADALPNRQFDFHEEDVRNIAAMRRISKGVSLIAHLAAYKIPRYSSAMDTLLVNSEACHAVLQIAAECKAKFLLASTSDVYGKNPNIPFTETDDCVLGPSTVARWAYAASKLFDEHLAHAYAEEHKIPVSIVRIFGSYGPRQNLTWWGGPQSVFIGNIFRGETIPIHGDGCQTRSFTYVSDTVRGLIAVAEHGPSREIFNIGNTQEITIVDLARLIHRLSGSETPLQVDFIPYNDISGRKYEDVRRRVPNISKAQTMLGFTPLVNLEEGLTRTIAWQRSLELSQFQAAA